MKAKNAERAYGIVKSQDVDTGKRMDLRVTIRDGVVHFAIDSNGSRLCALTLPAEQAELLAKTLQEAANASQR